MKNLTKRVLLVAMSLVLIVGAFAGCSGGGAASSQAPASSAASSAPASSAASSAPAEPSGEKVTLTYYTNPITNDDVPAVIAAFEAQYPNIHVEYVELPTETDKKSQTMSTILQAQDSSMDVFDIDTTWPLMYSSAGWMEPLNDVISEEELKQYIAGPIAANTGFDGKLYSLPQFIDVGTLVYRTDLLEKYGYDAPPKTWDELTEQATTIMAGEPGMSGFVSAWKQYEALVCCAVEFVWDYGGDVLDSEGNCVINSPEAIAGLQKMQDMLLKDKICEPGILGYQWGDARTMFNSGNVVFMRDWPDGYKNARDPQNSTVSDSVDFAQLPAGPAGSFTCLGGWSIAVSAFSEHKEEAKLFAKFRAGYDALAIFVEKRGKLPAMSAMYTDPKILAIDPAIERLSACAETTIGRPKTAYYTELSGVLQQGFGSILANTMTPEQAVESMQPQIQEIMQR